MRLLDPVIHRLQKLHLRRKILAAVRDVDRRDDQVPELRGHDAVLVVERRVREPGLIGKRVAPDVQPDARVRAVAVPVTPVALHLAERGRNLRGRGLDLLEADDVGVVAVQPLQELRLARANPIDVPGGDLERQSLRGEAGVPMSRTIFHLPVGWRRQIET